MTILQALTAFYDRLDKRGDAPQPGYSIVGVSFAIPINRNGTVGRAIDLRDGSGKRRVPIDRQLPKLRDHNMNGKDPYLFWDNTGYALGLTRKEMKRGSPEGLFEHFKTANLAATEGAVASELLAFRAFLETWAPSQREALGLKEEDLDVNIVFRSTETGGLIHQCLEAKEIWRRAQADGSRTEQWCLVTGSRQPIARLHPKFPALEAGGSKGPIVSFDKPAFTSYDKEQGDNAPVSEIAAFKYGAALNWLLDRDNGRRFPLGETTVVFWADDKSTSGGDEAATEAEEAFRYEMTDDAGRAAGVEAASDTDEAGDSEDDEDRDVDADNRADMEAQASDVRHLRRAPDISKLDRETRLHVLGLSPNAGRIAVRFWLVDTWGHLADNIDRFKRDIRIDPPDRNPDKKAYALLFETAVLGKGENIPKRLGGEFARAILSGTNYPMTLFASVVARIRADKQINAARAGLCKAFIVRNFGREDFPVALDTGSDDGAYNLGRLFAVYEYAEKGVADRNATIRDKFIGAASATPRRVFPMLMRGYEHNASALAKGDGNKRGAGIKAARAVSQILGRFDGELPFPTVLRLEQQGRFFVGYYHQMQALYTKAEDAAAVSNDTEETQQ